MRTGAGGQDVVHVAGPWLHDSMHSHTESKTPSMSIVNAPCAMGQNGKREKRDGNKGNRYGKRSVKAQVNATLTRYALK